MEIEVGRESYLPDRTIGRLFVNGEFNCYTLEDTDRGLLQSDPKSLSNKVKGKTAIPKGRYRVVLSYSPRFSNRPYYKELTGDKGLPLLLDVPGFDRILIHTGNTPDDTEGCILVGKSIDKNNLSNSQAAYTPLYKKISNALLTGEGVTITIS